MNKLTVIFFISLAIVSLTTLFTGVVVSSVVKSLVGCQPPEHMNNCHDDCIYFCNSNWFGTGTCIDPNTCVCC